MKKTALLLVVVMLLALISACKPAGEVSDISGTSSEQESQEVSDEVSQDTRIPVEDPESAVIISMGAPYTNSAEAGEGYEDSYNAELTDGQFAADEGGDYGDAKYSGYTDSLVNVVIDLGKVYDTIYEFRCSYLAVDTAGILPPRSVRVMTSVDGESFENAGYFSLPPMEEPCRTEVVLTSEYYISARYVKFAVSKNAAWVFLDELMVVADEEGGSGFDEKFSDMIKDSYGTLGTVSFTGGEAPNKAILKENVSKKCTYTVNGKKLEDFADDGKCLTDGKTTGYFETGVWAGYAGGESVSITVDLGEKYTNLCEFRTVCFSNSKVGTYMPVAVTYAVSDDKETFTDVGRVYGIANGQAVYDFPLNLEKCASGRYVRITLEATDTKMYLVEEVSVSAYTGVDDSFSLYPALSFDSSIKNWPNPSNTTVNLIQGLTQQINCPADIDESQIQNNTPVTSTLMTDGKHATSDGIHNGQFFKFNGGASRDIIYDLGATSAVKKFTAQFTHIIDWAVVAPTNVTVMLSLDGENWYVAGVMSVDPKSERELVSTEMTLDKAVQTRYVCFSINISTWCGVGELEVFGTTSVSGAKTLEASGLEKRQMFAKGNQPPRADVLNGAKDLVLLYHGTSFDGYTAEQLIPYLAYVDEQGNIVDTMFDSFLFLKSGNFPSGLAGWDDSKASDWLWTITDLFTEGENILALEEAAGQVKDALDLGDDYKYPFTVTLYHPNPDQTAFGDFTGDGENDSLATDEARLAALEWYMETFESKLAEYDFENIEFVGYYWYDESIYPEKNKPYIVSETSKIVHDRGYDFFWIPYYVAVGFSSWESFGFDVACMQPNYVFNEEVPYERLEQAAYLTQLYGMGIEIEISGKSFTSDILYRKYMEYLYGGVLYGYMEDCVHMYYQDVLVYYNAYKSTDAAIRKIYDYTYQFIKGTLEVYPDVLEEKKFSTETNSAFSGQLVENAPGYMQFIIDVSPEKGSVSIADDGTFTYYPEKDFVGEVSFTYTYTEGLCASEPCTVTITVG